MKVKTNTETKRMFGSGFLREKSFLELKDTATETDRGEGVTKGQNNMTLDTIST